MRLPPELRYLYPNIKGQRWVEVSKNQIECGYGSEQLPGHAVGKKGHAGRGDTPIGPWYP